MCLAVIRRSADGLRHLPPQAFLYAEAIAGVQSRTDAARADGMKFETWAHDVKHPLDVVNANPVLVRRRRDRGAAVGRKQAAVVGFWLPVSRRIEKALGGSVINRFGQLGLRRSWWLDGGFPFWAW